MMMWQVGLMSSTMVAELLMLVVLLAEQVGCWDLLAEVMMVEVVV